MHYDFGMIGLGVMGRNFLLNVAEHNFSAAGLDLDPGKAEALNQESGDLPVRGFTDTRAFVKALARPRRIMLLVPAGKVVDQVIADLRPFLQKGDLLIDGGNSHYEDTTRRMKSLQEEGLRFLGVGVSGGAEGARRGPSIMPGGDPEAYTLVQPILEGVAAKVEGEPCVAYMGEGAAGHFVKMVHNGIEYAMMQLIAEAYDLLRRAGGLSNAEIQQTFDHWNQGALRSFLIEITADIFAQKEKDSGEDLIDLILDKAKQKGTGKWTSQAAMDLGIPIPTIDSAVSMRGISSFKSLRTEAPVLAPTKDSMPADELIAPLEEALHAGFIVAYAQGLHLLVEASREYGYGLKPKEIAKIWRGGCIIRADMLEDIRQAFDKQPELENLMFAPHFSAILLKALPSARAVVKEAIDRGLPVLALASALHYVEAFHSPTLPLNLVQAQRDYFGSHTYERVDKKGTFHTDWGKAD